MKTLILIPILFFTFSLSAQLESDSLAKNDLFSKIKILPNPTSEILFIRNGEEISSYQLFNMKGEKVQESKNNIQIISLIDEKIGHYFLILEIQGVYKSYRVQKY